MELALYVQRIPLLTVEGDHLCVRVEITDTEAVAVIETLRLLLARTRDPQPTP